MIEPGDLRFIGTVLRAPSLSAAARTLHVTQSAVSQRLATLEKRLGVLLVDRSGRKAVLTDEGQLLARGCDELLFNLNRLNEQVGQRGRTVSGELRVLAPLGFGRVHVAPLVSEFGRLHRQVQVDLRLSDCLGRHPEEAFDIIIFVGELPDTALVKRHLARNRRIVCASRNLLAAEEMPRTPADLARLDFIALYEDENDGCHWRFTRAGNQVNVNLVPNYASNDGEVTLAWALEGAGFTIRSEWIVNEHLRDGRLIQLLPEYELPTADVVALFAQRHLRSHRVQAFAEFIARRLAVAPWLSA